MLTGYKTYITVIAMVVYNILSIAKILPEDVTQTSIEVTVNTVLGLLAVIFNYIGRKKIADK